MTADLDSAAFTAKKVQHALLIDAPEVAGEVPATARVPSIGGKSHRIELGPAPITGTDVRAADDNFTRLAGLRRTAIVPADLDAHAVGTPTNRNDRARVARAVVFDLVLCDQADLGRRELVDEDATSLRMRSEEVDVAREH